MSMRFAGAVTALALSVALATLIPGPTAAEERPTIASNVRIGMIGTLFRDMPESTVLALMQPFGAIMESQTGVAGELVPGGDAHHLGQLLMEDKVQLGIFHGIEFAWARQEYPKLRPLMIAVNQRQHLHAHVVVRKDCNGQCLSDLQSATLALPRQTREHCHVFLEHRCCQECKKEPRRHFAKITTPPNAEEALDDVIDGVAQVTIVDGVTLDAFKRRKPGRFARLKTIQTSEAFPAAVVAYRPGVLDEATLKRFREGMLNSSQTILGRQLLTLWKLTGFEPVPADYEAMLADIAKMYPPPASSAK